MYGDNSKPSGIRQAGSYIPNQSQIAGREQASNPDVDQVIEKYEKRRTAKGLSSTSVPRNQDMPSPLNQSRSPTPQRTTNPRVPTSLRNPNERYTGSRNLQMQNSQIQDQTIRSGVFIPPPPPQQQYTVLTPQPQFGQSNKEVQFNEPYEVEPPDNRIYETQRLIPAKPNPSYLYVPEVRPPPPQQRLPIVLKSDKKPPAIQAGEGDEHPVNTNYVACKIF